METGLEKIAFQRNEKQIKKHGFTGEHHANHPEWYDKGQLVYAAFSLSKEKSASYSTRHNYPENWDSQWWIDLCMKPYIERLAIAGSFLAAEIDRLQFLNTKKS